MRQDARAVAAGHPPSPHFSKQSAAAESVLLDTDEFMSQLEKMLGRVTRRKEAGPKMPI